MNLVQEIEQKKSELTQSIKLLRKNGEKLAACERDYKIKLRQEILKLRTEGTPVTLISQIIYGVPEVAELRFKRDVAEVMYQTNQEHINVIKLQLRLIEAQLQREWGASGTGGF